MNKFIALRTAALSATLVLRPMLALPQEPPIDGALARQYFAEAKSVSDKDNSALWTVLCATPFSSSILTLATRLRIKPVSRASSYPWMASSREKRQISARVRHTSPFFSAHKTRELAKSFAASRR